MTSTPKGRTTIKQLRMSAWDRFEDGIPVFDATWQVSVSAGEGTIELDMIRRKRHEQDQARFAHLIVRPKDAVKLVAALQEAIRFDQTEEPS